MVWGPQRLLNQANVYFVFVVTLQYVLVNQPVFYDSGALRSPNLRWLWLARHKGWVDILDEEFAFVTLLLAYQLKNPYWTVEERKMGFLNGYFQVH